METKYKVGIAAAIILVSFAVGRYTVPEKVRIETKTVEVEKKTDASQSETNVNKHKETTTHEVIKKDGSKEITTTVYEDTGTRKDSSDVKTDDTAKTSDTTKEITKGVSRLNLSALVGSTLGAPGNGVLVYGASISRDILGPVSLGAWGLTDRTVGFSVGFTF